MGVTLLLSQFSAAADLTSSQRTEVITALNASMKSHYVMPDQAAKLAELFTKNLASGAYDGFKKGADFAKRLTEDAKSICKDAHLRINYSDKPLPKRTDPTEPLGGGTGTESHPNSANKCII